MAYHIENMIAPNQDLPPYLPYKAGQTIIENKHGKIKDEIVLAILDASLMFIHPAEAFYQLIYNEPAKTISSPAEVYDWWLRTENATKNSIQLPGTPLTYNEAADLAISTIRRSFPSNGLTESVDWICTNIDSLRKARYNDPLYIVNSISNQKQEAALAPLMLLSDLPALANNNQDIFVSDSPARHSIGDKVLYWFAVSEVLEVLTVPRNNCELLRFCRLHKERIHPDSHCLNSPWKRSDPQYQTLCYLAAIWKTLGFANYKFE